MVVSIKQAFTFKKNKPEKTSTAQTTLGYLRQKLYEKVVIVAIKTYFNFCIFPEPKRLEHFRTIFEAFLTILPQTSKRRRFFKNRLLLPVLKSKRPSQTANPLFSPVSLPNKIKFSKCQAQDLF